MTPKVCCFVACIIIGANELCQGYKPSYQSYWRTHAIHSNELKPYNRKIDIPRNYVRRQTSLNDGMFQEYTEEKSREDGNISLSNSGDDLDNDAKIVIFLCFLVTALCALDRVAISVAIIPMSIDMHYSESTKGLISSFFSLGYMAGLIPAGLLGTFTSPKIVMSFGVLIWSIGQILSPIAAFISIPALLACRFVMGIAESVAIPLVQSFVARWVPDAKRSLYLSFILSGIQVGDTLAYLASPEVLEQVKWPGLFYFYGAIGFLWLALWLPLVKDNPITNPVNQINPHLPLPKTLPQPSTSPHPPIPGELVWEDTGDLRENEPSKGAATIPVKLETNTILATQAVAIRTSITSELNKNFNSEIINGIDTIIIDSEDVAVEMKEEETFTMKWNKAVSQFQSVPWREIISNDAARAICVSHCVQNFGLYIILSWLPTYFNQRYGMSLQDSSFLSVLPWIAGAICASGAGVVANKLVESGTDKTRVRRTMQAIAFFVPAFALLILSEYSGLTSNQAEVIFTLTCGLQSVSAAGFGSSIQDICKTSKYTSIIYGITSVPAVLIGSFGVYLTGVLLEKYDDWTIVFGLTSIVYVFGAIFYGLTYKAEKVFE